MDEAEDCIFFRHFREVILPPVSGRVWSEGDIPDMPTWSYRDHFNIWIAISLTSRSE